MGSEVGFGVGQLGFAGPVVEQPIRPRTPPGVGTPLRADGLVDATRVVELSNPKEWE